MLRVCVCVCVLYLRMRIVVEFTQHCQWMTFCRPDVYYCGARLWVVSSCVTEWKWDKVREWRSLAHSGTHEISILEITLSLLLCTSEIFRIGRVLFWLHCFFLVLVTCLCLRAKLSNDDSRLCLFRYVRFSSFSLSPQIDDIDAG